MPAAADGGQKGGGVRRFLRVGILGVLHHTDNFIVSTVAWITDAEMLANRFLMGEELSSEGSIDDSLMECVRILVTHRPAAQQASADGLEVVGTDAI